jgi:hypothetical protein
MHVTSWNKDLPRNFIWCMLDVRCWLLTVDRVPAIHDVRQMHACMLWIADAFMFCSRTMCGIVFCVPQTVVVSAERLEFGSSLCCFWIKSSMFYCIYNSLHPLSPWSFTSKSIHVTCLINPFSLLVLLQVPRGRRWLILGTVLLLVYIHLSMTSSHKLTVTTNKFQKKKKPVTTNIHMIWLYMHKQVLD